MSPGEMTMPSSSCSTTPTIRKLLKGLIFPSRYTQELGGKHLGQDSSDIAADPDPVQPVQAASGGEGPARPAHPARLRGTSFSIRHRHSIPPNPNPCLNTPSISPRPMSLTAEFDS